MTHASSARTRVAVLALMFGGGVAPARLAAQRPGAAVLAPSARIRLPPLPPVEWSRLIGEYGPDTAHAAIVLERDGKLYLREGDTETELVPGFVTGTPPSGARPSRGGPFRAGSRTVIPYTQSDLGVDGVKVNGVPWPRIRLGPAGGNVFRITPARNVDSLRAEALATQPPVESGEFLATDLVELTRLDRSIHLDIRYASTRNFMGAPLYTQARAFLQRPAAEALVRAHRALGAAGYGLLIHDGYRPWYVTKMFWEATPPAQHEFVANPATGSRHNRGCAVDLSMYDLRTGKAVEMPGTYDEFSRRSYAAYPGGTSRQRWLRELLRSAMEAQGFTVNPSEWWHFDYRDWRRYRIGNETFERLGSE